MCTHTHTQLSARREETKAKFAPILDALSSSSSSDYAALLCKCLELMLECVNVLRIDAANARLGLMAAVIKDHGVDYERGKFNDKLQNGTLTLERTTQWINASMRNGIERHIINLEDLKEEGNPAQHIKVSIYRVDLAYSRNLGSLKTCKQVHSHAMLFLVTGAASSLKPDVCPETLLLDVDRISKLQLSFHRIVIASTMLVTTVHAVANTELPAADCQAIFRFACHLSHRSCMFVQMLERDLISNIFSSEDIINRIDTALFFTVNLIDRALQRYSAVDLQTRQTLTSRLQGLRNPTDSVRNLMWVFLLLSSFLVILRLLLILLLTSSGRDASRL